MPYFDEKLDINWDSVVTTNVPIKPPNHVMASPDYATVLSNIHAFYNLLSEEERKIEMKRAHHQRRERQYNSLACKRSHSITLGWGLHSRVEMRR